MSISGRQMGGQLDGQCENSLPPRNTILGGYNKTDPDKNSSKY